MSNEIIKNDLGGKYINQTNRDKSIISGLKLEYKLNNLLTVIQLVKFAYYYDLKAILRNKYGLIRKIIWK